MPPELKEQKNEPLSSDRLLERHSKQDMFRHHPQSIGARRPSFWNRIYLKGIPYRPIDLAFLLRALVSIVHTLLALLFVDLPFLFYTGFSKNSDHHPASWKPFYSFCMSMSRASSSSTYNVAQLRLVSNIIAWFIPLRMMHLPKELYSVKSNTTFKVHLDTLLKPERDTLLETRQQLGLSGGNSGKRRGGSGEWRNPLDPSPEYLKSFLPNEHGKTSMIANLPEESGVLDSDGTYTLHGEWIEALEDPAKQLPERNGGPKKSNVVLLYAHGGGHVFCSAKFHRQLITRMLLEFGPGARAFVVEYRLAPEDPFPAAIHDMYAAYLYLTQLNHEAITLCNDEGSKSPHHSTPINPKDIVLGGDSAGAGMAIALQLYLRDYIRPSVNMIEMPPVTILISAWTDISTSMPSATNKHSYCYTPSPMGVNPFEDQKTFYAFPKFNFARAYLCGDSNLVPNERNSAGKDMEWEWYRHLAQHPLVSPVYTADLSGLESSTLLQTGAFDRLADDSRLYAHRLGAANPDQRVRLELYRDMVHVHQFFEFLPMADKALQSIVAFVVDAQERHSHKSTEGSNGTEWVVVEPDGTEREGHDDDGTSMEELETYWTRPERREM